MKKIMIIISLCLFLIPTVGVFGATKTAPPRELAFVFNLENILLAVDSYNDGYQAGLGVKYWLLDNIALRGLVSFDFYSATPADPAVAAESVTDFGIGVAAEIHPKKADVSPYFGGLASILMHSDSAADLFEMNFAIGAILGGEVKIKNYLSAYAEYALLFVITPDDVSVGLGAGNGAQVGLLFYLNRK